MFLRTTNTTSKHTRGLVETIPAVFSSKDFFSEWAQKVFQRQEKWDDWVDRATSAELKFLIDYLINLKIAVHATPELEIEDFGLFIKDDFIDLSVSIKNSANYFFKNIDRKTLGYSGNGKLKRRHTEKRMGKTKLATWMHEKGLFLRDDVLVSALGTQHQQS
jgi:hypothetical protein